MPQTARDNWTIHDDFPDKYKGTHFKAKKVDCERGLEAGCRAQCCSFFFGLSPQDVEEGIIQWDENLPFMGKRLEDGYCVHLDRKTYQCTIREARPVECREYSCVNDIRIPKKVRGAIR